MVVWQHYSGSVSSQYSYVKFSHDFVHQKLLKLVHFCRVIQNRNGGDFWDSIYMYILLGNTEWHGSEWEQNFNPM